MTKKQLLLAILSSSIFFTMLFHQQTIGLNLLIFESAFLAWVFFVKKVKLKSKLQKFVSICLILTLLFTTINYSVFTFILHFIVLAAFVGLSVYEKSRSLVLAWALAINNFFASQVEVIRAISTVNLNNRRVGSYLKSAKLFLIPMLIILVFFVIYRLSNPVFDKLAADSFAFLGQQFEFLFKHIDLAIMGTFLLGLIFSSFLFVWTQNKKMIEMENATDTDMKRQRIKHIRNFRFPALKNEYRSGVFLLLVLNAIILVLNVIDVKWVWFNFQWEGQYLKQFVHEGTYLLILSILISICLVLYYFRGNLNFYSKNSLLKILSYIWLFQNAILAVSVGIRNVWYIDHFALAYKRIGVFIFLMLTIYGLYSVFIKVMKRKSAFFLFRNNLNAALAILVISSLFNWDIIIARHNFSHANKSFLHLDFMATLSDKALPYLDKSEEELMAIDAFQKANFPFEYEYLSPEKYHQIIRKRKNDFKEKWERKTLLSWNLREHIAYKQLFEE